jgi:hypothetical protein
LPAINRSSAASGLAGKDVGGATGEAAGVIDADEAFDLPEPHPATAPVAANEAASPAPSRRNDRRVAGTMSNHFQTVEQTAALYPHSRAGNAKRRLIIADRGCRGNSAWRR